MKGETVHWLKDLLAGNEAGEVVQWVLISAMSAALVISLWAVANERLVAIVKSALDSVCGSIGC